MKYVMLIRHGESYTNRSGILSSELNKYRLTDEGINQAKFTGEQLAGMKFDGIISSPVLRAMQTAEIINQYTKKDVIIEQRAIESDFGDYNGQKITEIPDRSREELGMESFLSQQKRMVDLINSYDGNYIVVSHAFPIKCTIAYFLELSEIECFGIDIKYASMSVFDVQKSKILSIGSLLISDRVHKLFD
ncbi:MAG: 2,3-diphosphoglycerate-dependent phosphoglycerate mutase [Ferroplasma sp.]